MSRVPPFVAPRGHRRSLDEAGRRRTPHRRFHPPRLVAAVVPAGAGPHLFGLGQRREHRRLGSAIGRAPVYSFQPGEHPIGENTEGPDSTTPIGPVRNGCFEKRPEDGGPLVCFVQT